jgi:arabinogalactan oligomer/maltooligosaccharide transport system substrate-binding protein
VNHSWLSSDASSIDWGTLPAWVSSAASTLALLFAATAAIIARKTFKIQDKQHRFNSDDRHARLASERAAQASLVSIWCGKGGPSEWGAFVRNSSQAPVYQVHVTFVEVGVQTPFAKVDIPVVPPDDKAEFHPVPAPGPGEAGSSEHQNECRARLTFTDAVGSRWIRDEYGRLSALEPELSIWSGDDIARALEKFQRDFHGAFGVTVTFTINNDLTSLRETFMTHGQLGDDVDVLVGPHDWLGALVDGGAITPAVISNEHRATFLEWTIEAMSLHETLYGIPATMDTVVLIRNTDLAPDAPETFDDVLAVGESLKARGAVSEILAVPMGPEGDPYHMWPIFTGGGGWLFRRSDNGALDPEVVGFDTPESVLALARIGALGESGTGVLRREIDRVAANQLFIEGRVPFILGMYNTIATARQKGVPVAVSTVPGFRDGIASMPFVTVSGFYFASSGKNRMIAQELIPDYLTRPDVMAQLSAQMSAPVARRSASKTTDPAIEALSRACAAGTPMPAFPEMTAIWHLLAKAQVDLIAGRADPETVARRTARSMTDVLRVSGRASQ